MMFFIRVDELLKTATEDDSLFDVLGLEFMNKINFIWEELLQFNGFVGT